MQNVIFFIVALAWLKDTSIQRRRLKSFLLIFGDVLSVNVNAFVPGIVNSFITSCASNNEKRDLFLKARRNRGLGLKKEVRDLIQPKTKKLSYDTKGDTEVGLNYSESTPLSIICHNPEYTNCFHQDYLNSYTYYLPNLIASSSIFIRDSMGRPLNVQNGHNPIVIVIKDSQVSEGVRDSAISTIYGYYNNYGSATGITTYSSLIRSDYFSVIPLVYHGPLMMSFPDVLHFSNSMMHNEDI